MVNTYKVVLCGKTGVGKTSIFQRMCGRSDLDCQQTVAKTTKNHECKITTRVDGTAVQLDLWDTLGLEQHAQYTRSHFLLSQAVLFVYSATDKDSLIQAAELLTLARVHAQGACFILIRNKIDLDPTVSEEDVMESIPNNAFALQFRTSALRGTGIQEMLQAIAVHLFRNATPMKSIGRSLFSDQRHGNRTSYSKEKSIVKLEFEEEPVRRRRRKCCST